MSFVISVALNGGKIDKTTFMDAAIGGLLGLIGAGIAGGLARGLATGFAQKLITGLMNSKVWGPILRGGGKLIGKLPGPFRKIFTKAGFINAVEGVGTSITDDLLRGRKINWKMALLSGVFGAGMVGVATFAKPVIDKATASIKPILAKIPIAKNLDDCFAYNQTPGYLALADGPILPKCLYSPDKGGAGGGGNEGTNPSKVTDHVTKSGIGWDMPRGGGVIGGRRYSEHALERMAPDTIQVRAELSRRATEKAIEKGLKPGTKEFDQFVKKYVDPRGIPPMVVEDAIRNTPAKPGKYPFCGCKWKWRCGYSYS